MRIWKNLARAKEFENGRFVEKGAQELHLRINAYKNKGATPSTRKKKNCLRLRLAMGFLLFFGI